MGSLALSPGSDQSFFACSDTFQFTATALDLQGLPLADVQVVFGFPPIVGGTHPITGSFTPFSGITDANGEVSSNLSLDLATCAANCANTLDCSATVEARDLSGAIHSNTVLLVDQVQ